MTQSGTPIEIKTFRIVYSKLAQGRVGEDTQIVAATNWEDDLEALRADVFPYSSPSGSPQQYGDGITLGYTVGLKRQAAVLSRSVGQTDSTGRYFYASHIHIIPGGKALDEIDHCPAWFIKYGVIDAPDRQYTSLQTLPPTPVKLPDVGEVAKRATLHQLLQKKALTSGFMAHLLSALTSPQQPRLCFTDYDPKDLGDLCVALSLCVPLEFRQKLSFMTVFIEGNKVAGRVLFSPDGYVPSNALRVSIKKQDFDFAPLQEVIKDIDHPLRQLAKLEDNEAIITAALALPQSILEYNKEVEEAERHRIEQAQKAKAARLQQEQAQKAKAAQEAARDIATEDIVPTKHYREKTRQAASPTRPAPPPPRRLFSQEDEIPNPELEEGKFFVNQLMNLVGSDYSGLVRDYLRSNPKIETSQHRRFFPKASAKTMRDEYAHIIYLFFAMGHYMNDWDRELQLAWQDEISEVARGELLDAWFEHDVAANNLAKLLIAWILIVDCTLERWYANDVHTIEDTYAKPIQRLKQMDQERLRAALNGQNPALPNTVKRELKDLEVPSVGYNVNEFRQSTKTQTNSIWPKVEGLL